MKLVLLTIVAFLSILPGPVMALSEEESDAPTRTLADYIKDYIDIPQGGTDWKVLGSTKESSIERKDADDLEYQYYKPVFSDELKKLDGKEIILKGFMFPLDSTEEQKLFLFGPFPINCPFQYHVGPSLVVEVHADKNPVTFSYDPLVLKGTLELVHDDPENSVFYRLKNAKKIH